MRFPTHSNQIFTFLALSGLLSTALSSSIPVGRSDPTHSLFARDDKNCKQVDSRLPDTFKCHLIDSKCISLDDGSSAICCTDSGDCKNISPITCDIQRQNVATFPRSAILTTSLKKSLATCGSNCCPFGYDCITPSGGADPYCAMIVARSSLSDSKESSSEASPPSSTSVATISQSTATGTPAALSSSASTIIDSEQHGNKTNPFPPGVFLAGLFPGIAIGALLLLGWVIYSGRHKKSDSISKRTSYSSNRPVISGPIPMTGGARSDFARRFQARLSKAKSTFSNSDSRTDSNPWKTPNQPNPNNVPERPVGLPVTPKKRTQQRDSAVESIRIYSPPSMVQHPSATVPPLRTMSSQRRTVDSLGSPFPPAKANGAYEYNAPATQHAELLGSQRYEDYSHPRPASAAPSQRYGPDSRPVSQRYETVSRPLSVAGYQNSRDDKRDTSFTALMAHCGIPDSGDQIPVPKIPKPYESRL